MVPREKGELTEYPEIIVSGGNSVMIGKFKFQYSFFYFILMVWNM